MRQHLYDRLKRIMFISSLAALLTIHGAGAAVRPTIAHAIAIDTLVSARKSQPSASASQDSITRQDSTARFIYIDSVAWKHPRWAVKNNLLYDATLTPNLGMALRLSRRVTLELTAGYNPFTFSNNRKWKHLLVAPGLRYYTRHAMHGHFFGADAVYSHYNVGNVRFPFGLYPTVRDERRQGDLYALGLSYGYEWHLASHLHLQAEMGMGAGYTSFDRYECRHCGSRLGSESKLFLVPKLALSVVWAPGCRPVHYVRAVELPQPEPEPEPEPFVPVMAEVMPNTGKAGQLQRTDPVLHHISEYRPYDRTRILRKEKDALYVHFELDKAIIARNFRRNDTILTRIVDITRQIMADSTSNVRRIQLIGLASIEGGVKHNEWLGQARAEALAKYIKDRVQVPDTLFDVCNGGEAWADFRDQLNDLLLLARGQQPDDPQGGATRAADMPRQGQPTADELRRLIDIIDTEPDPQRRELRLKRMDRGRPWQYIKRHVLADQRNSGYIRIYYDYVPDTNAAVINAASQLVQQERYQEAALMLRSVRQDPRSWNTLGVALYMSGQREQGLDYLRRAAEQGNTQAQENLEKIED